MEETNKQTSKWKTTTKRWDLGFYKEFITWYNSFQISPQVLVRHFSESEVFWGRFTLLWKCKRPGLPLTFKHWTLNRSTLNTDLSVTDTRPWNTHLFFFFFFRHSLQTLEIDNNIYLKTKQQNHTHLSWTTNL